MSGIKKALALVLALIMMIAIGAVSASAVDISKDDSVAADEPLNITLHVMQDGLAQPYVYLWNSLPTNSAMSQAYPGEKMNLTGEWFTYTVRDVTKVNVLITDADGKQYCRETKITSASADWYFFRGRWTKYDPTQVDPAESLDPREDTLYFVMTTRFYDGDSGNNVHCWDDHVANNPDSDPAWRGNFGESHFSPLFTKDTTKDLGNLEECMVPTDYLLNTYGLTSPEQYWAQQPGIQYQQRLNLMKNVTYPGNLGNGTTGIPEAKDYEMTKMSTSEIYNPNNYYHSGYFQNPNYDDWTTKFAQIAGDCVDLNTENPAVAEYITDTYGEYIARGVDGFRVDTVRHIPRVVLNLMFNQQLMDAAAAAGKPNFLMFGEICTRYTQVWYRGHAEESAPYYTWKESNSKWANSWNWGTSVQEINDNMNLTFDHYKQEDDPSAQPTSQNAFLNGLTYHTPDRSRSSGMEAIDFTMHRMFGSASNAYGVALSSDKYYNDATYNVMYVDSHDYSPEQPDEFTRFQGGTQAWAENLDLMFTFRGIPCVYYGSEIEFQKGALIDKGTLISLAESGRAYYGDHLEGDVEATDFCEYTASGTVKTTLESTLSQHLMKLNKMRRAIPALQKGQYAADSAHVTGDMAYIRRFTDDSTDSLACVTISGGATFKQIPNGLYIDAVTGDRQTVTNGTLTVPSIGKANMRVYVCCASGFTGINGAIGSTSTTYLK